MHVGPVQKVFSNAAMKQHQHQRRTRGNMENSGGMNGIAFEVIRSFQQRARVNKSQQRTQRKQSLKEKRGAQITEQWQKSWTCSDTMKPFRM